MTRSGIGRDRKCFNGIDGNRWRRHIRRRQNGSNNNIHKTFNKPYSGESRMSNGYYGRCRIRKFGNGHSFKV